MVSLSNLNLNLIFVININTFYYSGSGCSLKRYCTNKQFQNKQFKRTNIIKTEHKGYGICAVEDIPKYVN